MTLDDVLHSGHGYDEVIVVDQNENECLFWQDEDEKYQAKVIYTQSIGNTLKICILRKETQK